MSFLGSQSTGEEHGSYSLSQHVKTKCILAYTKLEDLFIKCRSGEITLNEIKELKKESNMSQLKKLCDAILLKAIEEEQNVFKLAIVEHTIKEANAFINQKKSLTLFYNELKKHEVGIKGRFKKIYIYLL